MTMKKRLAGIIALAMLLPFAAFAAGNSPDGSAADTSAKRGAFPAPPAPMESAAMAGTETAVLAGGCFWGVEAVFEELMGVKDVQSGYSGGDASTADYSTVSTGTTGHAESVKIVFDPSAISYGKLLEVFFAVAHDPTQLNYQGPDHGTQYRSAIFYANDTQRDVAEQYIRELDDAGVYPKPIVTQVVPLKAFYPAESYHQDFIEKNPNQPYVVYWDLPKLEHLQRAYPELVDSM